MELITHLYGKETEDVVVNVTPFFMEERSNPRLGIYFFAYKVSITNLGNQNVKVLGRTWKIRDGKGQEEIVKGQGVVGKFPNISPGSTFEYTSFCPLETPSGNMRGEFHLESEDSKKFDADIPLFFLRTPFDNITKSIDGEVGQYAAL
ncbi:MAG: Co2+/Mg2+ efflux protein ApaG [Halobacteriovoraceae bacterium]|nr:Co2+/Mg2+ efflux protein ApaG [Halobacteriovoraceae bacterium]